MQCTGRIELRKMKIPNLNRILLAGRLTRDPEVRKTSKGTAVADLGLAYNRRYKNREDIWMDEVSFFKITVWGEMGERCGKDLEKGSALLVEGRLHEDSWEDESGEKKKSVNIVASRVQFLDQNDEGERDTPRNGEDEMIP